MDTSCIFCKIVKKEIPAEIIAETNSLLAFPDVKPSAPVHILIIPKTHYQDINGLPDDLLIEIKNLAISIADDKNMSGYRLIANVGDSAMITHMHVHLLSGIKKNRKV
jgi:histidine triad (HIT) family protein